MSDRDVSRKPGRRILYGRRQGHKLRQGQQKLLETLLPRIAVDLGALSQPEDQFGPDISHDISDVWLEIGFGGGEHLAVIAAANPTVGIIGCEPFVNGVAKLLAQIAGQDLQNVRLHQDDARDVLEALPDASLGRAMLLFPDPWPKTRHHKRRFVNEETVSQLARVLRPGGEFRVATDIPDYCRWTLGHVVRSGRFDWLADAPDDWRLRPDDWPATRYEKKAIRQGRTPIYLRFRRKA